MKELGLKNLCDVVTQSLQEHQERLSAYHQLNVSAETVACYRQASETEQRIVNELFYKLTGKSFESLMHEFLEQFKKQSAVFELMADTLKLSQQLKYHWPGQ